MKYITLISLMMINILSSTVNAFPSDEKVHNYSLEDERLVVKNVIYVNVIQKQLIEMCRLELGCSLEDVLRQNDLIKSEKRFSNDDLVRYNMIYAGINTVNIFFKENLQLEFYEDKLENVLFRFNGNGEVLKDFFISKWGIPRNSIMLFDRKIYMWQDSDYQVNLIVEDGKGSLIFSYMPYKKVVSKIKRLEYAEHLKTSPEAINRLENLVKNNEQFKVSFKRELQNDPDYAEALQKAGMDMSIFN